MGGGGREKGSRRGRVEGLGESVVDIALSCPFLHPSISPTPDRLKLAMVEDGVVDKLLQLQEVSDQLKAADILVLLCAEG